MSQFRKIFEEKQAKASAEKSVDNPLSTNNPYELQLAQLGEHSRNLSKIKGRQLRNEQKLLVLPEYEPYLDGVLAAATGQQDDVVAHLMLWNIDCDNIERGLQLGEYAVAYNMAMPGNQTRDAASALAEELSDASLERKSVSIEQLQETLEITRDKDMHDQIAAKLQKSVALALIAKAGDGNACPEAIPHLQAAIELNPKIGLKPVLSKLQKLEA